MTTQFELAGDQISPRGSTQLVQWAQLLQEGGSWGDGCHVIVEVRKLSPTNCTARVLIKQPGAPGYIAALTSPSFPVEGYSDADFPYVLRGERPPSMKSPPSTKLV